MRPSRGPVNHRLFSFKRSRLGGSRRSLKVSYLMFFSANTLRNLAHAAETL